MSNRDIACRRTACHKRSSAWKAVSGYRHLPSCNNWTAVLDAAENRGAERALEAVERIIRSRAEHSCDTGEVEKAINEEKIADLVRSLAKVSPVEPDRG